MTPKNLVELPFRNQSTRLRLRTQASSTHQSALPGTVLFPLARSRSHLGRQGMVIWWPSRWSIPGLIMSRHSNGWSKVVPDGKKTHRTNLANYSNSLTWIKAIWGWFPLLTMISSELVVIIYPECWKKTNRKNAGDIFILVGGFNLALWNMMDFVNGKDYPIYYGKK